MRQVERALVAGALMCLLMVVPMAGVDAQSSSSDQPNDTWSGAWSRTEEPGKQMILTQTGNQVSGTYDWNDASGHISGTVNGDRLAGGFTENHYEGSFILTLAHTTFTGSYTGKNKDTGGPISGSFDGTCVAGECKNNAPQSNTDAHRQALEAVFGADYSKLADVENRATNGDAARQAGTDVANEFRMKFPVSDTSNGDAVDSTAVDFVEESAKYAALSGPDGKPMFPAVHTLLPVLLRMAANASVASHSDPAEAQSILKACTTLFQIALGNTVGIQPK